MHIRRDPRRDRNVVAAWALAVSDEVRMAAEGATGLGGGGPAALVAVVADPGMSIDGLRRILNLTHPGAVRLVDRLVKQGWVRRDHGVGRSIRLEPTKLGRQVERRIASAREQAIAELLAMLSDDAVATMADLVEPVLAETIDDTEAVRRLCRLCDRRVCTPCPTEAAGATDPPSPEPT